jgi:hypothetical protein
LIVKHYDEQHRTQNPSAVDGYTIGDKVFTRVKPKLEIREDKSNRTFLEKAIDTTYRKTIISDSKKVYIDSTENAILYKNGEAVLQVESCGLVPNAIYQLSNLNDIVDINTGETIAAGTTLGSYITDSNGKIKIDKIGTDGFANPNKDTQLSKPYIKDVVPSTISKNIATGELPNGAYALILYISADDYREELGLCESVILNTGWTKQHSAVDEI